MSIFDWLFGWKPEKYKWYVFYDRAKSLRDCDLNFDGDRLKVKPYAVINGKKYRGKFYVTSNYCEIIADKNKLIVPLKRCKFLFIGNYLAIITDKNKLIVPLKRCKFRKNLK